MKFLGQIIFLMVGMIFSNTYASGGTVGNGGDGTAAEFVLTAQTAVELFKQSNLDDVPEFSLSAFTGAVATTSVSSEDRLILEGKEVDAINYPSKQKLKISRSRWKPLRTEDQTVPRFLLVIHEYLWLSGVDDSNYRLSNILIQKISPSHFSTQRWWEPMNPTNRIGFSYVTPGCTASGGSFEFDLSKDEEQKTLLIEPRGCAGEDVTVRVRKVMHYEGTSDGLVGKSHTFELSFADQNGKSLGAVTYAPTLGNCLVPSGEYCSQSGIFLMGSLRFSFGMKSPPLQRH